MSSWGNYPLTEEYKEKVRASLQKGIEGSQNLSEAMLAMGKAGEETTAKMRKIVEIYNNTARAGASRR